MNGDPFELKREFCSRLAFMGGVRNAGVLPSDRPARAARHRPLIEGLTNDGVGLTSWRPRTRPAQRHRSTTSSPCTRSPVTLLRHEASYRAAAIRHRRLKTVIKNRIDRLVTGYDQQGRGCDAALEHRHRIVCPWITAGSAVTGMHESVWPRSRDHYGLVKALVRFTSHPDARL
jgi:hypothetical protein